MIEAKIGTVLHFFAKPMVAAIRMEDGSLALGNAIHFKGHATDLYHRVESIQVDHEPVENAGPGDLIGIPVPARVREHDMVYRVSE